MSLNCTLKSGKMVNFTLNIFYSTERERERERKDMEKEIEVIPRAEKSTVWPSDVAEETRVIPEGPGLSSAAVQSSASC